MLEHLHADETVEQGELRAEEGNCPSREKVLLEYLVNPPTPVSFISSILRFHIDYEQRDALDELDAKKD